MIAHWGRRSCASLVVRYCAVLAVGTVASRGISGNNGETFLQIATSSTQLRTTVHKLLEYLHVTIYYVFTQYRSRVCLTNVLKSG